jgi:hypothetical protein
LSNWNGQYIRGSKPPVAINELFLDGLESLTLDVSQAFESWRGRNINLSGVKKLSPKTAKSVVQWTCPIIRMRGVTKISTKTAKILVNGNRARLKLSYDQELSPDAYTILRTKQVNKEPSDCYRPTPEIDC